MQTNFWPAKKDESKPRDVKPCLYLYVSRSLRDAGQLIGTNDLWIACTAPAAGVPVVTRNVEHFRRVPELGVMSYVEEPR